MALLNAADLCLVLGIDHVNIVALLIRQHGSARNGQHRDRLHALQQHGDEFSVDQFADCQSAGGQPGSRGFGTTPRSVIVSVFSAIVGET